MDILINVVGQQLKLVTNLKPIVSGTQKFIRFKFNFNEDWDGLSKVAQFIQEGKNAVMDYITDNMVYLPSSVEPGECILVLYGTKNDEVRATTNYLSLSITKDMVVDDAHSVEMNRTVMEMIIEAVTGQTISPEDFDEMIQNDVNNVIERYREEGILSNIVIEDGTITRVKVDPDFEATLAKADTAMQQIDANSVTYNMLTPDVQETLDTVSHLDMAIPDGSISRAKVNADFEATLAKADTAMQSIDDGSISRAKVDADFEATLAKADSAMQNIGIGAISRPMVNADFESTLSKADSAMQPSVYNPNNIGIDPYTYANTRTSVVTSLPPDPDANVNYLLNDNGKITQYRYLNNTWVMISGSSAEVRESLPLSGDETTDYYILNELGTYSHYRWINDDFVEVGSSSSTIVVDQLPDPGISSIDYILSNDGEYQYYKWIDNDWRLISGGSGEVIAYENTIDYYFDPIARETNAADYVDKYVLDTSKLIVYYPIEQGENTYTWGFDNLVINPSDTKDYYVQFGVGNNLLHFRYVGNKFISIGTLTYSKEEIDAMIQNIETTLGSEISTVSSDVSVLKSQMNNISNMVKDVTINQNKTELTVTYMNDTTSTITLDTGTDIDTTRYNIDDDHKLHFYDSAGNELEGLAVEITGAGGGTVISGSVTIGRVSTASIQTIFGDECQIEYTVTAVDASGEDVGDGIGTLYVNNVAVLTGFSVSTSSEGALNSINVGEYLSVGTNTIKISVNVDTGGETNTTATKTWSVNAINMYLSWSYTDSQVNTSAVTDYYTPFGALNKTIYTFIDVEPVGFNPKIVESLPDPEDPDFDVSDVVDVNYFVRNGSNYDHYVYDETTSSFIAGEGRMLNVNSTTRSGIVQTLSIPMQSHGSHSIVRFMTGEINGEVISTACQVHDMIFVEIGETSPIISTSFNTATTIQYNTVQIPIVVYDPNRTSTTVVLAENGETVSTWTNVDRTLHYWNYVPTTYGTKTLTIRCGSTTKTITIEVTELSIDEEEIGGYDFRFKASEMATNSAVQEWSSNYRPVGSDTQKTVSMTFSENFDWVNGGLHTEYDEDNHLRQYFCVRAGTTVTINYNLFGKEYDPKQYGKNFKFIFKAVNCRTYDASVLSCMDTSDLNNGVGLVMTANEAMMTTANNSLKTYYYKDSYIEFETNIHPDNEYPYLQLWMDGSHDTTKLYDSSDSIQQVNPVGITIGSPNCDVYIYMIKAYPIYLTNSNELSNFIMDAPNAYEMVDRYNRNDILNANGEVDYQTLANANPDLHVLCLDINRMSTGKKDNVVAYSVRHIYNRGGLSHCFTVNNACVTIQGTSSVGYLESAGNVDINFKYNRNFTSDNVSYTTGDVVFDDGTTSTSGYSMTSNSIPVDYMNVKLNVASSENANNACIADWYNTYQPWTSPARAKNGKARDTMEFVPGVIFIRDRSGGLFYTEQQDTQTGQVTRIPDTQNYHLYGICDIGNSKKNTKVFHDTSNPIACCVEVSNNTSLPCLMSSKTYTWNADDEATIMEYDQESGEMKEQKVFEFRYVNEDSSKAVKLAENAWDRFVSFMYDYNPNLATNEPLSEPVTFGNYTFRGDGSYDTSNFDNENYNVIYLYGYGEPASFGYAASEFITDTSEGADCYYYINYSNNQIYSSNGSTWSSVDTLTWTLKQNNVLAGTSIGNYAGTYTTDSFEYRMAYLLNHCEEYMIMDPVIYHFVFIESFLMTDNVAKNTFWSSDDLVHWEPSKDYDNDRIFVVVKSLLIYGETPEMGNASEV